MLRAATDAAILASMRKKILKKKRSSQSREEPTPDELIDKWATTVNKLTPSLIEKFCALARQGDPAATICNYLGITESAFHRWIRRGEEYRTHEEPEQYKIYGAFVAKYRKATAEFLIENRERMITTEGKDWYRYMCIAERRDRKNWGKNEVPGGDDTISVDERFD